MSVPDNMAGATERCPGCNSLSVVPFAVAQEQQYYDMYAPAAGQSSGKAVASLVLGIVGLIGWILPIVGLPVTITGLVLGVKGRRSPGRGMATAGIVMCILGLIASVINSAIGAYLGATGRLG